MQNFSKHLGILTAFIPSLVFGDVTVQLNQGTNVVAVNGQEVDQGNLFNGTGSLTLENGKNQIAVEYTAEIEESADDFILETSETYVLLFEAEDTAITLTTPDISSQYELKKFNRSPQWKLIDAHGQTVPYTADILKKEGFQLARNYETELKVFNKSNSKAALPELQVERHTFKQQPVAVYETPEQESPDQKMVGQMLQFWYQQADQNTRDKFKSWIKTSQ